MTKNQYKHKILISGMFSTEDNKNESVYCILDFLNQERGPDNYGGKFKYSTYEDCEEAIKELHIEAIEISRRNGISLNVSWVKTLALKQSLDAIIDGTTEARNLVEGMQFKLPRQKKFRKVGAVYGDNHDGNAQESLHGKILICMDDCSQTVLDPDQKVEVKIS